MDTKYRTSLEISKQLKEAGFPQECDAYYHVWNDGSKELLSSPPYAHQDKDNIYAAPCVGRLGDELPKSIMSPKRNEPSNYYYFELYCFSTKKVCEDKDAFFYVEYINKDLESPKERIPSLNNKLVNIIEPISAKLEADARALMWLELKKKNLI